MKLSDQIWITRKARINSEKRLNFYNTIANLAIIYYSAWIAGKSIWLLIYPNQKENIFIAICSIIILIVTVYISGQKFSERANNFKSCYLELQKLYFLANKAEEKNNKLKIEEVSTEYNKALTSVENHTPYDYLCLRFEKRKDKDTTLPKMTFIDYFSYFGSKIAFLFLLVLLATSPFIIQFLINLWSK